MFLKATLLVCLCLWTSADGQQSRDRRPTVRIPQGQIMGVKIYTDSGKLSDAYFGIPYATPPIANLRFKPPQRHQGWNGTLQCLNYRSSCPQLPLKEGATYTEDCLYLNVWSPESTSKSGPLPVVIFIEGSDYSRRNPISISGQDLAMEGLIIVTLNYRMNVFGFFCLGVPESRGNLGILDQYFAILWVRENIRYFGGDPDKITLFGHGAGASSAVLHMISPRTSGMFQRIIISSGSVMSPWHLTSFNDTIAASGKILKILGCFYPSTYSSMKCVLLKKTDDVLRAYDEYYDQGTKPDMFLPVVDSFLFENDRYLSGNPADILRDGTFPQVPILTGTGTPVSDPRYSQWSNLLSQSYAQLQHYIEQSKIPEIMNRYHFNNERQEEISELIKWRYEISGQDNARSLLAKSKQLDYDVRIEAPHFLQLAQLQTSYVQPIYVYHIDTMNMEMNLNDTFITADLLLLFGPLLLNQLGRRRFNSNEFQVSRNLKQLWVNFINFGNPTPGSMRQTWQPYMANTYHVEELSIGSVADGQNRQVNFWTKLLPKISHIETPVPNYIPIELQRNLDPTSGYRHALYTLVALVISLLVLLLICITLLKRRSKERERHLHMTY